MADRCTFQGAVLVVPDNGTNPPYALTLLAIPPIVVTGPATVTVTPSFTVPWRARDLLLPSSTLDLEFTDVRLGQWSLFTWTDGGDIRVNPLQPVPAEWFWVDRKRVPSLEQALNWTGVLQPGESIKFMVQPRGWAC